MENKKYLVFRIDSNCSDTEYSRLSELLNNGYVIFNEYKFADFAVIILNIEEKEGLTIQIDHEKINRIIEKQKNYR